MAALRLRACGMLVGRLAQHRAGHAAPHSAVRALATLSLGSNVMHHDPLPTWRPFGLATRLMASDSSSQQPQQPPRQPPQHSPAGQAQQKPQEQEAFDSLELTEEKINAITDKIPQRPVGVVEGTGYSIVILAAFGVLIFFVYQFVTNFLFESTATTCFNTTLERLRLDPRITVRLGNDITGYGNESASRVQRSQIPHVVYKDNSGVEHVRLQFHMRGPSGVALVSADMYKDGEGKWQYSYLIADVRSGNSQPQRINIISPALAPAY